MSGTLLISAASCVLISQRVQVSPVSPIEDVTIASPVKAHLEDGSTVVFAHGVEITGGMLRGEGVRYDLALDQSTAVDTVPLQSVAAMESFTTEVNTAQSVVVSSLATTGVVVGSVAIFKAIFGSCPTVYSHAGEVEEAELFSSSIAPLFEARDLDRLKAQPEADGILRLEIRNEALETHYINHLELLEVRHTPDEFVVPDSRGRPLIVGPLRPVSNAVDRLGRSLDAVLADADGDAYSTDPQVVDAATAADLEDWIDLTVEAPAEAETVALVFTLRNSLLSTTLFYDVMLASAGARAIDWMNQTLGNIASAVELGRWYQSRGGLRISVWQDGGYREVARIPDSGPIAWHEVTAVIPTGPESGPLRVRVSFVADHWRIDRIQAASTAREAEPRPIPLTAVTDSDGRIDAAARENMAAADDRYLQTTPGQRFFAAFEAGPAPATEARTFLLSSQGYYTEWIRGEWIRNTSTAEPFVPDDAALLTALRTWSAERLEFEARFREARVPVQ